VAGAKRTHGHEQIVLECDVSSNGTRRRSCDRKLLREMRERDGIDPNYAPVISDGARVVVSRTRARLLARCARGGEPKERMVKQRRRL
jgi:hypothetical protein